MPFNYIDLPTAKEQKGLRMVVVAGLPSPWSEAAKGIFHLKKLPWSAVYLNPKDNELAQWTGSRNAPVAIYNNEPARSGWADILFLAERLSSSPPLLPSDPKERALAMGLSHEICGEMGLGWTRRLEGVHKGLNNSGGFPKEIAQYLAHKYGYQPEQAPEYQQRIVTILTMLSEQLKSQKENGSRFYIGSSVSMVDIYSATFMAYFKPLPAAQCPMYDVIRTVFETMDDQIAEALDPILLEHRDFIYSEFLELPLSL
ncbi:hypothetical protein [Litoribacillus peritrichatus]|uniref:Glutathione S-transferase n=1 Tax=Litoribacillus peritrichatus TaxID=718191 RepID=A0ABP7MRV4_9GAMM